MSGVAVLIPLQLIPPSATLCALSLDAYIKLQRTTYLSWLAFNPLNSLQRSNSSSCSSCFGSRHLLLPKLTRFFTDIQPRLKSRQAFVPAAKDLQKLAMVPTSVRCTDWIRYGKRSGKIITPASTHILQTSLLHHWELRSAWVRFNRLRTGIERFRSNMYKWDLAASSACECGEEQTADHIINNSSICNPPERELSLGREDKILVGHHLLPSPGVRKQHK